MNDETRNRRTVAAYFSAVRRGDREGWVACFADDAVSHDPPGQPPLRGHGALRAFFDGFTSQFSDFSLHEGEVRVVGDQAAAAFSARGTSKPGGKSASFDGIDVFRFDGRGRIVELRCFWDPAALQAQLQG